VTSSPSSAVSGRDASFSNSFTPTSNA
jgi:hypothetical protein